MRTLSLRKDTLVELAAAELRELVGGAPDGFTDPCITRPVTGLWCLTRERCS